MEYGQGEQQQQQQQQHSYSEKEGDGNAGANASALDDNVRKITGIRWVLVCVALYISTLMYGLDTTIAADVQAAVVETFGEVSQLAWVGAGFPLGSVAVILPYGALFATFNMKWLYVSGVVFFQAGSALCGAAPSMNALIVGRVLAGLGGTGMYLGALNHFSALTSREERATYITGIAFVWGIGSILGPVIGGSFSVSPATWRWGFYINLVVGAVTAPVYLFFLPPVRPASGKTTRERLAGLDFLGFALSAGVWVSFGLALISAGGIWSWRGDGRTIATLTVFGVLLAAYALQQYFCFLTTPAARSFPGHLLRDPTQVLLYVTTSCAITALFVVTYYVPVYFQFVQNDTALRAAVRLLPFLLVAISTNLASGWALARVKYYMPFYLAAGVLLTISGALLVVYLDPATPPATIYGLTIVAGLGAGATLQLGYAVATLKVRSPVDVVHAINFLNVSQIGSTTIALVLAGQIFQSVAVANLSAVLAGRGFSADEIQSAVAGAQSTLFDQLSGDLRDAAVAAITGAMQKVFILVIIAGALELLSALAMKRERLFGEIVIAA
ncbi:MFS drug efflux transporter [Xylariales sp. PMI_506]|nr:MFS drug efflux transporter [Xylariales sp. PMI_506]